jgi:hypothetical protein
MHIITNLYFRISLNFIFKSDFTIYMHKKIFASYITIHLIQKNLHVILFIYEGRQFVLFYHVEISQTKLVHAMLLIFLKT